MKKELIFVVTIALLAGSSLVSAFSFGAIGNAIGSAVGKGGSSTAKSAAKLETRTAPKAQSVKENHPENSNIAPTVGRGANHLPCQNTRSSDDKPRHSGCN